MGDVSKELPHDEPAQIVVTGEAGSGKWNPAYGAWEADDFGMDSAEPVGLGERLFVNRKLYDALQSKVARLEAALEEVQGILRPIVNEHDNIEPWFLARIATTTASIALDTTTATCDNTREGE